eukprot:14512062-Alexandrium_andersonii.AAC.1
MELLIGIGATCSLGPPSSPRAAASEKESLRRTVLSVPGGSSASSGAPSVSGGEATGTLATGAG